VPFSIWKLPGRKALSHDGAALSLIAEINQQIVRIAVNDSIRDGQPFAFQIPARADAHTAWPLLSRIVELLQAPSPRKRPATRPRPSRGSLNHQRTLQALDGAADGATHREISEAIFGAQDTFHRWSTDSELRAQVRYLLHRGRKLVSGGYRQLLSMPQATRKGESVTSPDSP